MSDAAQRALDHIEIYSTMSRYCHGVDRCDLAVLKSTFWPDATCNYSDQELDAMTWAENCVAGISQMERTMHTIGNHLIEVDGDKATGETYCLAYHLLKDADGALTDMLVGGRYLDHFEKRDGEWKIKSRFYVMDWNHNIPSTGNWTTGLLGGLNRGARSPNDHYDRIFG